MAVATSVAKVLQELRVPVLLNKPLAALCVRAAVESCTLKEELGWPRSKLFHLSTIPSREGEAKKVELKTRAEAADLLPDRVIVGFQDKNK